MTNDPLGDAELMLPAPPSSGPSRRPACGPVRGRLIGRAPADCGAAESWGAGTAEDFPSGSFLRDLRMELARLIRPPRAELAVILGNALLVCVGWLVLPAGLKDWLFSNLQGPLAFVIVLETWTLSDVTSTNLLAHDPSAALGALERVGGVRKLVRLKVAALALLIGPPCAVIAVVIAVVSHKTADALYLTPVFVAVPFAALAVGSWLGVLFPYRARSLRWRWRHRRPWARTIRWACAVLTPFVCGGAVVTTLATAPMLLVATLTGGTFSGKPPTSTLAVMAASVCATCSAVFVLAPMGTNWLATVRRRQLRAHLQDPDAG